MSDKRKKHEISYPRENLFSFCSLFRGKKSDGLKK